jgi:hypothetical protein
VNTVNVLVGLIVVGPLVALAGPPAVAGHSRPLLVNQLLVKVADNDDFAARKDAYLQKSRNDMAEWQRKMHVAGERGEAQGHEAAATTRAHLDRTWTAAERSWRDLQAAGAEGWDSTKNAYERSAAELRVQWHQLHPDDKD